MASTRERVGGSGKHTYTATLPDGTVVKRTTHRTYVAVIAAQDRTDGKWLAFQWVGRLDLIQAAVQSAQRRSYIGDIRSVPCRTPILEA